MLIPYTGDPAENLEHRAFRACAPSCANDQVRARSPAIIPTTTTRTHVPAVALFLSRLQAFPKSTFLVETSPLFCRVPRRALCRHLRLRGEDKAAPSATRITSRCVYRTLV